MRTTDPNIDPKIEALLTKRIRSLADRATLHARGPETTPTSVPRPRLRPALVTLVAIAALAAGFALALLNRSGEANWAAGGRAAMKLDQASCIVFMNPDATPEQITDVGDVVTGFAGASRFVFYSQRDAYDEFRRIFKDKPDLVASVTEDVLPSSFRVKLEPDTAGTRQLLVQRFDGQPGVRTVSCND